MGKKKSIDHAQHNESACEYLLQSGHFSDWVITTAYYSAIHFVCAELFPGKFYSEHKRKENEFDCFDNYFKSIGRGISKHAALLELVEDHLPEIYFQFKTMKDLCWNARYLDYNQTTEDAKICREALREIRELCTPLDISITRAKAYMRTSKAEETKTGQQAIVAGSKPNIGDKTN